MSPPSRAESIARPSGESSVRSEPMNFSFDTPLGCSTIAVSEPPPGPRFRAVDDGPEGKSVLRRVRIGALTILTLPRDIGPDD
ncbi:MAG TPA: hypothetical protein DCQ98_00700 [Planctomycetaceae bacterium]|nr:hypothetical protein [Planctomycetaceae bacterium]